MRLNGQLEEAQLENLSSDPSNLPDARVWYNTTDKAPKLNIGSSVFSISLCVYAKHSVTDGQSATNLTGETVDSSVYSSARYEYEIIRGTTVFSSGEFYLHYRNSTWQFVMGSENRDDSAADHGVTFSITGTTTAQLRAALDTGAGNGSIKLRRFLYPV